LAGKRVDRGPVLNGESALSMREDLCFSCFTEHYEWRLQETVACGRCGAPQCAGHLVLGVCTYCDGLTDAELRESRYAEVT